MTSTSLKTVLVHASDDGNAVLVREFDNLPEAALFVAEAELRRGEYVVVSGQILMRRANDGVIALEPPTAIRNSVAVVAPAFDRRKESVFDDDDDEF